MKMKHILTAFLLLTSSIAISQNIYNKNSILISRFSNNYYYDGSGNLLGRLDGERVYDKSANYLGRIDNVSIYNGNGNYMGRVDEKYPFKQLHLRFQ